jgi:DNA mismatch endonuclease (patch repair protein)
MARQLPPSPKARSATTTKVMKANKAKGTKPEIAVRQYLWAHGFRGYRLNYKGAPGRPDICFVGTKIAIFVHGCFWHRCPNCSSHLPKTNSDFWKKKFELNVARDIKKEEALKASGWTVIVIWECQIPQNLAEILSNVFN